MHAATSKFPAGNSKIPAHFVNVVLHALPSKSLFPPKQNIVYMYLSKFLVGITVLCFSSIIATLQIYLSRCVHMRWTVLAKVFQAGFVFLYTQTHTDYTLFSMFYLRWFQPVLIILSLTHLHTSHPFLSYTLSAIDIRLMLPYCSTYKGRERAPEEGERGG